MAFCDMLEVFTYNEYISEEDCFFASSWAERAVEFHDGILFGDERCG